MAIQAHHRQKSREGRLAARDTQQGHKEWNLGLWPSAPGPFLPVPVSPNFQAACSQEVPPTPASAKMKYQKSISLFITNTSLQANN